MRKSLLVLLMAVCAMAVTRTWDGGGVGGDWATAANWSDDTGPTDTDTALFSTGAAACTVKTAVNVGSLIGRVGYTGPLRLIAPCTVSVGACSIGTGGVFAFSAGGRIVHLPDANLTLQSNSTFGAVGSIRIMGTGSISLKIGASAYDSVYCAYPGKTSTFAGAVNATMARLYPQGGTFAANSQFNLRPVESWTFDQNGSTFNGTAGGNGALMQIASTGTTASTFTVAGIAYTGTGSPITLGSFSTSSGMQTVELSGNVSVARGLTISKTSTSPTTFTSNNYSISTGATYPLILSNTHATNGISHHFGSSIMSFGSLDTAAQTGGDTIYWETSTDTCKGNFRVGSKQFFNPTGAAWTLYMAGAGTMLTRSQPLYDVVINPGVGVKDSLADSLTCHDLTIRSGKLKFGGNRLNLSGNLSYATTVSDTLYSRMTGDNWAFTGSDPTLTIQSTGVRLLDSARIEFQNSGSIVMDSNNAVKAFAPTRNAAGQRWTVQASRTLSLSMGPDYSWSGHGGAADSMISSTSGTRARIALAAAKTDSALYLKDMGYQGAVLTCTTGCYNGGNDSNVIWDTLSITAISPSAIPAVGGACTLTVVHGRTSGGTVTVDGSAATLTEQTATRWIFTAPAHASGSAAVVAQSGLGLDPGDDTVSLAYSSALSISPSQADTAGGDTVALRGSGFGAAKTGSAAVSIVGHAPSAYISWSDTLVVVVVAAHSAATGDVVITSSAGLVQTLVGGFTYFDVMPVAGRRNRNLLGAGFMQGRTAFR